MSQTRKFLFPALVLLGGVAIAMIVFRSKPAIERQVVEPVPPLVRVIQARPTSMQFEIESQGTVRPRTQSTLSAQVPGQIQSVSKRFGEGESFNRGDVLVAIDPRDARAAVSEAEAMVAQNRVALEREQAEAALALEEWQDLGRGEPSSLTLREPQLAQARASLAASEAVLERARLNLERTTIRAPFTGRLRTKLADVGQYVAPGTPLAELYATDSAEIQLPVAKDELSFLDLDLAQTNRALDLAVLLSADIGGERKSWRAKVVRAGAEIDARTRMLNLFARVDRPLELENGPLPIGLFVEATIAGVVVDNAIVLPRSALRGSDRVLVVDENEQIHYRDVEVLRAQSQNVILAAGVDAGELVCVSPIETVVNGMKVRTVEDETIEQAPALGAGS